MVSENEMIPIRIKFTKKGNLMYISHLDLAKTMQRIVVRSDINIWYSEGFNPQPKLVFAVPLPVGVESDCELLDIRITKPMPLDELKERLENNFPQEMKILDVYTPSVKFKHIAYIDYTIRLHSPSISKSTEAQIKELFSKECNISKTTKSGNEKTINLCDFISSMSVSYENDDIVIQAVLCADSEKYLNPELLIDAIRSNLNILNLGTTQEYYSILRNKMLNSDLTEFI